jgi:hypothetical protein
MSKLGGEIFPGRFCPAAVGPQGHDTVAGLEELGAHGDKVLVLLEETTKEVSEYVIETNVDTAVRKALDDFPADVRCQHLPDDVRVAALVVEPTDGNYMDSGMKASSSLAHHCTCEG